MSRQKYRMNNVTINIKHWFAKAFNTSILQKSRMPWVDYLRGIAILLVVYRHALIGIERSGIIIPQYLMTANMIFYSFRMPLFFIVSGLFIGGTLAKKNLKQIAFIKFENLLYPYFIWAFIQITLQIILVKFVNSDRGLKDYTYLFYQPRALDQFWYLPALFNATMIYVLIKTKLRPQPWMQIVLGLILYFVSPLITDISMLSDWMEFYLFFAIGDIGATFFFKDSVQRFFKSPLTLLALIPVFTATQLFYLTQPEEYYRNNLLGQTEFLAIAFIGCLSMFVLAFRFQAWKTAPFLRIIGFHSLYIYVIHVLVIAFFRVLLTKLIGIYNPFVLLICDIAFGVSIPVMFYNLVVKDNIGWFLFSLRKPGTTRPPSSEKLKVVHSKVE
ncbi:MAG: acyltransferase [Chitinophagaceae bacterium]